MKPPIATRLALAAAFAAIAAAPALAQPYQQGPYQGGPDDQYRQDQYGRGPPPRQGGYDAGYRDGYRAGFQAARQRARYDDRVPAPAYGGPAYGGPAYGGGDPSQRWRQRYGQTYSVNDDRYYQECRNQPDPAGVLGGALIGGLLGNAVSHGHGAGTVAGVIVGGAAGFGLTQHMQCQDRSYAYKTYYEGLNSGRPHSDWQWDDPDNGHYGDFRVGDYYNDQDGFRCANYTQQIWVEGRPEAASGRACQQPDGTWAFVG